MEYDAIIDVLCSSFALIMLIWSLFSKGDTRQYLAILCVLLAGLGGMFS